MKTELTQEIVRELLDYDPETGIMTWKKRGREWFKSDREWKRWNTRFAGREAGHCKVDKGCGYTKKQLKTLGTQYLYHRVVWLWMTGEWPADYIDHINRDATDNRWCNLRVVSRHENSLNRSKMRNNTSGVTGVTWHKRDSKWQAEGRIKGEGCYLGSYDKDDFDSAVKAVEDFRREHGFSEGHGKEYAHYYTGDSE